MPYTDYEFYQGEYRGELSENEFERLIVPATAYVDMITFGRASEVQSTAAKLATCAVVDEAAAQEKPEMSSQTVGPWTQNYTTSNKGKDRRKYDAAAVYLAGTGLLYRGLDV